MKVNKHVFQAICFSLLLTGCNKAIPSEASAVSEVNTETKTVQTKVVALSTRLSEIDKLIKTIDSEAESITPKEYETSINVGVYACGIKDFGQKKETFCFDGGMKAREILAYYGKDRILKAAIYTIMKYNASPANLAEFDESKTSQMRYKLIFKEHNDPMYTGEIESVYDENNEEIPLTEDVKSQWNSFTAAVPPY